MERDVRAITPSETLGLWARFGVLAGFAEVVVIAVVKLLFGQFVWLGPHVLWMAPLASLVVFVAAGVPFALWALLVPRFQVGLRLQLLAAAFIAAAGAVSILPGIHWIAVAILSLGIAVQGSRALAPLESWRRVARRTGPVAAAAIPAAALAVFAFGRWEGWQNRARGTPPDSTPNVLLITLDTERASSLDLYENSRPTSPRLTELASTATTFDLAFATAPWTLDTHATLLTGRYPHEVSTDWESALDDTYPTLAEYLAENGYETGAFVANLFYCSREFGLNRGFAHFEDMTVQAQEFFVSTALGRRLGNSGTVRRLVGFYDVLARKDARELTDDFLDWEEGLSGDRPFFAWLNYFDAHELYLPPSPFDTMFATTDEPWDYSSAVHRLRNHDVDSWRRLRSDAATAGALGAHEGAIAYVDRELDRLFRALSDAGQLDNTVIVVTSDHGEQFGEHGLDHHGNRVYTQVLRVPLVIRYPSQVPPGRRVDRPVTLRDLPATIVSLAGVGEGSPFPGEPLDRIWGEADTFTGNSPILGRLIPFARRPDAEVWVSVVVDDRYHYIVPPSGDAEVYDLIDDVEETTNLARREDVTPLLPRFRQALDAAWSADEADVNAWKEQCAEAEQGTEALQSEYVTEVRRLKEDYDVAIETWEAARNTFAERKKRNHKAVARQKRRYKERRPEAIEEYCDLVLSNSEYPHFFPKRWHLDYRDDDRTLVVDYWLPRPDALPTLKRGQYLEASDEFVQQQLPKAERNRTYSDVLCQTVLRTIHELFEADVVESIDFVTLNGRVVAADPATGLDIDTCVVSVKVSREGFLGLDLRRVKARNCVSRLNGGTIGPFHKLLLVEPLESCRPLSQLDSSEASEPT